MNHVFLTNDFEISLVCPICGSKKNRTVIDNVTKVRFLDIKSDFTINKCFNCQNSFLNPHPKDKILSKLYPKQYFESYRKFNIKPVPTNGNKKYLEIGIGDGSHLQKIIDSQIYSEIWIVDVSDCGFRFDKQASNLKIKFIHKSVDMVKLPDNYFDMIYLSHVIEHTSHPVKVINNLYKGLNLNGCLDIFTPNFECLSNWLLVGKADYSCPHHLYFFTIDGFVHILNFLKIKKYTFKTHWGNTMANTLAKGLLKILLSPISVALEIVLGRKDTIELIVYKSELF